MATQKKNGCICRKNCPIGYNHISTSVHLQIHTGLLRPPGLDETEIHPWDATVWIGFNNNKLYSTSVLPMQFSTIDGWLPTIVSWPSAISHRPSTTKYLVLIKSPLLPRTRLPLAPSTPHPHHNTPTPPSPNPSHTHPFQRFAPSVKLVIRSRTQTL